MIETVSTTRFNNHFKKPNCLKSTKFRKQRNYFKKERVKNKKKLHVS